MSTEIIYGTNPVLELMRSGKRRAHQIVISSGRREGEAKLIEDEAARRRVPVKRGTREEIALLAKTEKHQGVAARCDPFPYAPVEEVVSEAIADGRKGFMVILDGITDPQNLGSIVRTAHLMGVHGIVLPRDNAAAVSPSVVKASAGATEYLNVSQVTNIAETIRYMKEQGFWVAGAAGEGRESLYQHDFLGQHVALVLGAEGSGLRRLVREKCDFLLSIPMEGAVGSYNVSVAGALFMGEVMRQRMLPGSAKTVPKSPQIS